MINPNKTRKTARIDLRVTHDIKKLLIEKAHSQNLDLTGFLEKVAVEPIIFISKDIRLALEDAERI